MRKTRKRQTHGTILQKYGARRLDSRFVQSGATHFRLNIGCGQADRCELFAMQFPPDLFQLVSLGPLHTHHLHTNMHTLWAIRERETGRRPPSLPGAMSANTHLLHRLKLDKLLDEHDGCVNTVQFTPSGDLLLSGSDDLQIIIWDWATGQACLSGGDSRVFA